MARSELGEDAVVLNTKHIKANGLKGLRGATKVELMAAVDDDYEPPVKQSIPEKTEVQVANHRKQAPTSVSAEPAGYAARVYASTSDPVPTESDIELSQLRSEVKNLSAMVKNMLMVGQAPVFQPSVMPAYQPLIVRLGIEEELVRASLSDLLPIEDPMALASALAGKMQAFANPPVLEGHRVIALVGPTGVGKTTTLAKLAARFTLEHGKKVALVTADTYRIGAVEQLRTYARIMGIPLEIGLSPEEVSAGVQKHADKDIVLIDTVGRSQRNEEHLAELKTFVDAAKPTDTYLVVAASLSNSIQREVVDKFTAFSPTSLVMTKLDESEEYGGLVNLPLKTGLGISCITAGQNVPQDIDFADAGIIARLVTGVA